jgi:uncharacterized protein
MTRRTILIVISWICLVSAGAAQALSFPALTGRVVDEANLFDPTARAALTETLAGLESKTTDQLVVVTLKSLQGTSIEDYGYQLGRKWQIGQKDKNNGALLIVAPNERKVRIEVGYGLEGLLTDALTKLIIENSILPRFMAGDFAGGVNRGVDDIIKVLNGNAVELQQRVAQSSPEGIARPDAAAPVWLVIILVLGGVGLLIYCAIGGGALCQAIMQILILMLLSGGHGSSRRGGSSWSGGGGSFGGGGSSGRW